MANETRTIQEVGRVGGAQASPKAMQANKPEPEPLQRQKGGIVEKGGYRAVVRSLARLLQDEKPKNILIVTGGGDPGISCYDELLGIVSERGDKVSAGDNYKGVADKVRERCAEAGANVAIFHTGKFSDAEMAAYLHAKLLSAEAQQNQELIVPRDMLELMLESTNADLVLHLAGCLCCFRNSPYVQLAKRFGNEKVFVLTPNVEHLEENLDSFAWFVFGEVLQKGPVPEIDADAIKAMEGTFRQLLTEAFGKEAAANVCFKAIEEKIEECVLDYRWKLEIKRLAENRFFVI